MTAEEYLRQKGIDNNIVNPSDHRNDWLFLSHLLAEFASQKDAWIKASDRLPENTGSYLCISNDEKYMVCHLAANGWWSIVPSAQFYGDMGEKVVVNSKEVEREVIYWTNLPTPPND